MEDLNRRSAMALGLTAAAAVPLVALARPAGAAEIVPAYGPNDGEELSPGVRMVEVGTWDSDMTGIKSVQVLDIIYQPGAADSSAYTIPVIQEVYTVDRMIPRTRLRTKLLACRPPCGS